MSATRGRHQTAELKEFLSGDERQAWARRPGGGLAYLPEDGGTQEVRRLARAGDLRCPVDDCGAPLFTLVTPTVRRHFFRHRPATAGRTGHGPETTFHVQAKHLLRRWALHEGADARVEATLALPDGRHRRADVLATRADGERVAFEVEYKALDVDGPDGWDQRSGDYAALGIADVWLFGHAGAHVTLKRRPAGDDLPQDEVALTATQQHLAAAGRTLRWINPVEEAVATAVVHGPPVPDDDEWWQHPEDYGPRTPRAGDTAAALHLDPLDDCRLAADGMITPTDLWLAGERDAVVRAADEAREAAEQAEAARAAADLDAEREAAARAADRDAERRRWPAMSSTRPTRDSPTPPASTPTSVTPRPAGPAALHAVLWHEQPPPPWDGHPLRAALERLCGSVPEVIDRRLPTDDGVLADHRLWHATVYARLVHGNAGLAFNAGQVVEALFQDSYPHRSARGLHQAGTAYLDAMRAAGWLAPLRGSYWAVLCDASGATPSGPPSWDRVHARGSLPPF